MRCPECGHPNSTVVDTRPKANKTKRYRRHVCDSCRIRFSTMECYTGKNATWNQACNEAIDRIRKMKKELSYNASKI